MVVTLRAEKTWAVKEVTAVMNDPIAAKMGPRPDLTKEVKVISARKVLYCPKPIMRWTGAGNTNMSPQTCIQRRFIKIQLFRSSKKVGDISIWTDVLILPKTSKYIHTKLISLMFKKSICNISVDLDVYHDRIMTLSKISSLGISAVFTQICTCVYIIQANMVTNTLVPLLFCCCYS